MSGIRETPAPDWQPIATAPKDNVDFLLLSDGDAVWFGVWIEDSGRFGPYWSDYEVGNSPSRPTHWMPLPEPPVTE